jgi:hypothetical protein
MRFIKNNAYNIVRLMVCQFGMMIFGLVLSFATASMQGEFSDEMFLIVSLFSVVFHMVIIYYTVWELGARDIIRVETGRQKYDRFYGTKISLIANLPNILFAFLGIVGYLGIRFDLGFGDGLYTVSHLISGFIQAPYLGVIKISFASVGLTNSYFAGAIVYFVTIIPSIAVTSFAYILGCKNFRFIPSSKSKNQ